MPKWSIFGRALFFRIINIRASLIWDALFKINTMKKILLIAFSIIASTAFSQSLPKIQTSSIRTPANVKIDGNLSEWGNKLQARNNVDGIFYTISNNNDNLYLTLIAPYKEASRKAIRGGVTFSVSLLTDKERKKDPAIKFVTYPLSKNAQLRDFYEYFEPNRKIKTDKDRDSLAKVITQAARKMCRTINIDGQIFPVNNNNNGIIASISFNQKFDMIYELAIPLKHLGLSINYVNPFSYNIRLNGMASDLEMPYKPDAAHPIAPAPPVGPPNSQVQVIAYDSRFSPTDFWGEYKLSQ